MWIVVPCIVLDPFEHDPGLRPTFRRVAPQTLPQWLAVSPVTTVKLSAAFTGDLAEQKHFLDPAGISYVEAWPATDTELAHPAWHAYVTTKRRGKSAKKPVANIFIGELTANRTGLVTRNSRDFTRWFPALKACEP